MNIEKEFTHGCIIPKPQRFIDFVWAMHPVMTDQAKEWQQQTFIKVWKHRKSFQEKSSVSTWIYRIAVNTCLGDLRKAKKQVPLKESLIETA